MLLNEQLYKNFYRPYFRGQRKDWDIGKANFKNESYFTTSPFYAYFYAKGEENGVVVEYRLNNNINIFNLKSKKDYFTLHKFLVDSNENKMLKCLDDLKNNDWTFIIGGDDKRAELLDIIKKLGYDGFFNYEYTKSMRRDLDDFDIKYPLFDKNPAIGVFNSNVFKKVATHQGDDIKKVGNWEPYIESEKEYISQLFAFYKDDRQGAYSEAETKFAEGYFLALDANEFVEYTNDVYAKYNPIALKRRRDLNEKKIKNTKRNWQRRS